MQHHVSIVGGGSVSIPSRYADTVFARAEWHAVIASACRYATASLVLRGGSRVLATVPLCVGRDLLGRRTAVALPFTAALALPELQASARAALVRGIPAACSRAGIDRLQLRLNEPLKETAAAPNLERVRYELALDAPLSHIVERSSADHRRRVRAAREADKLRIDTGSVAVFYDVYRDRMKELGSPAPAPDLFGAIERAFGSAVTILAAYDRNDGRCAGAMFLVRDGRAMRFLWGASLTRYRAAHVNHVLYREAIALAHREGAAAFDFGRSDVRSGTCRFKRQFGGEAQQLFYYDFDRTGARERRLPRGGMSVGSAIWKRLPWWLTDFAGGYVAGALFP